MNNQPANIDKATNVLIDRVSTVFSSSNMNWNRLFYVVNVFLWGVVLTALSDTKDDVREMKNKEELTQVYVKNLESRIKVVEKINE